MSVRYSLIDTLLPFEWTEFAYMKNAFLAVLLITPLFGLVGTMVVNNKMSFFSDALGHSAPHRNRHRRFARRGQLSAFDAGVRAPCLPRPMHTSAVMSSGTSSADTIIRRVLQHRLGVGRGIALRNRGLWAVFPLPDRRYPDRAVPSEIAC